ncbi:MAG: MoaD/ThiS family protein [Microthrixaceae bacterium]|nr:MoaD/ThiS family protein [Microthrixaceae bacterium]
MSRYGVSCSAELLTVPLGMPVVLLFAQAREAVGASKVTSDAETVAGVLEDLSQRFGAGFGEVLATSSVWCNGDPVDSAAPVGPTDELAVLPPVSGG